MPVTRRGPMKRLLVAFLFCGLSGANLSAGADDVRHAGAAAVATLAGDLVRLLSKASCPTLRRSPTPIARVPRTTRWRPGG